MSQHHASLVHGRASKYLDRHFNRQAMKILPGEFYATREDEVIVTVLGSCVAACLLDPIAMVGGQNAFFVRQFLKDEGIPLWVEDMGGKHPRKVYFFPHTGQVLVKRIEHLHNDTVLKRERTYSKEISETPAAGDVELF